MMRSRFKQLFCSAKIKPQGRSQHATKRSVDLANSCDLIDQNQRMHNMILEDIHFSFYLADKWWQA